MSSLLSTFMNWLVQWASHLGKTIINFLVDMLNGAIAALATFAQTVLDALPNGDPLPVAGAAPVSEAFNVFIGCLNWLFPIQFFLTVTGFALGAVLLYVVAAPLARWVKLLR